MTTEDNLTGNGNGNGNGNSQTGNSHTLSSYQWRGNLGLSLNPTMPGPSPESAAPPEGLVFTAHRKRKLSYSARQLVSPATEEYGDPSPISHQWLKPAGGVPAYSDDGFNGDADLLGDNSDPGDPRDGITSATGALVSASPNEPGAHQVETGGARSIRIIGPYGTPTNLIGTYTATNAYSPPDTIESNSYGGFNPGQAVGKLEGVSYFQGAGTNGWQGNGVGGVASYTVTSTWSTATEQGPTVTYTDPETGDTGTSSATYRTQGASMEQVEVRLQTNKEVVVDKPLSAVFVLTKTTTPMEGSAPSSEFAAVLRLTISSGKLSNVCEVVSGTLPAGVTTQGGVVSMRSPAPVAGQRISYGLMPVELYSDLNNDGQLTSADAGLVGKAYESGASDEEKAKGTEHLFANDQISNGAHDREDTSSDDPLEDDDDAKGIHIKVGVTTGKVWLDHPAIDALTFYKHKSCYPDEKLKLKEADPFDLEGTEQLPATIYARCDGDLNVPDDNPQSLGDLVLKYLPRSGGQYIQMAKTKVVVVKEYGAEDFFQTANDYIMENNAKMYSGQKDYDNKPLDRVAVTVMRQEATKMEVLDTVNNANPWVAGIRDVVAAHPNADVIINGNMTFNRIPLPDGGEITKQCHGRLVSGSRVLPGYSDNPNSNIPTPRPWFPTDIIYGHPLRGSDLAGINGKYLAMKGKGEFFFVKGRVKADLETMTPAAGMTEAMGGLGTNYAFVSEAGYVGSARLPNAKKMLFTVIVMNPGRSSGLDLRIADDAKKGGVQKLQLRDTDGGAIEDHELELFRTDGASSLALAVRQPGPAGALKVTVEGNKHIGRVVNDYVIHTYLSFTIDRPRGEMQ